MTNSYHSCIDECLACAIACENCLSACLNEEDVSLLTRCMELDRECALVCFTSAQLMAMGGEHAVLLCSPCAEICDACAEECEKHEMEHCRNCASACRKCAEECRRMAGQHV